MMWPDFIKFKNPYKFLFFYKFSNILSYSSVLSIFNKKFICALNEGVNGSNSALMILIKLTTIPSF